MHELALASIRTNMTHVYIWMYMNEVYTYSRRLILHHRRSNTCVVDSSYTTDGIHLCSLRLCSRLITPLHIHTSTCIYTHTHMWHDSFIYIHIYTWVIFVLLDASASSCICTLCVRTPIYTYLYMHLYIHTCRLSCWMQVQALHMGWLQSVESIKL